MKARSTQLSLSLVYANLPHRWIKSKFTGSGGGGIIPWEINYPFLHQNWNILTNFIIFIENRTKIAIKIVISCEIIFNIFKKLKFTGNILWRFKKSSLDIFLPHLYNIHLWNHQIEILIQLILY